MLAAICASAAERAASAASRAMAASVLVADALRSRLLMARNASAISNVTESSINVRTSATPLWD